MSKPRLLDLFCGAGGAAMGYSRAGFEVVGVDVKPQPNYPFEFWQLDALGVLGRGGPGFFAAVHASPPCQAYIQRNKNLVTKHPKLIEPTRERLRAWGMPYVIENVLPEVLEAPTRLCGTAFGLSLIRHRYFECGGFAAFSTPCHHEGSVAAGDYAAVYSFGGKGHRRGAGVRDAKPAPSKVTWEEAMGIDWMERHEIREAIPPAYTEYIGRRLMEVLL